MSKYDPARNSIDCHALAVRAIREVRIRAGLIEPRNETERRWRDEGEVPPEQLDCVRDA